MNVKETKISIIGAGALGGAVARGLAKAGCHVTASDPHPAKHPEVSADGVNLVNGNSQVAQNGEVVMFAVKPHLTLGVIKECEAFLKGKLCISLAAAVQLDMLREAVPAARWARVMTNIGASINCAFSGIAPSADVLDADRKWMLEAFALLGAADEAEEKNLDALTSLTGAGPAFFMSLMESAAMGGIQAGLPKGLAYKAAASALICAARLAEESGRHPAALRDDVCTPAGMTIEGIYEIERSGARAAMMRAIVSTAEKGRVLTEKIISSLA